MLICRQHVFSYFKIRGGADPLRGGLNFDHPGASNRKITKNGDFTLPLRYSSVTIMYLDENFLCKNALKVKFTLSLFDPPRTPLKL